MKIDKCKCDSCEDKRSSYEDNEVDLEDEEVGDISDLEDED